MGDGGRRCNAAYYIPRIQVKRGSHGFFLPTPFPSADLSHAPFIDEEYGNVDGGGDKRAHDDVRQGTLLVDIELPFTVYN